MSAFSDPLTGIPSETSNGPRPGLTETGAFAASDDSNGPGSHRPRRWANQRNAIYMIVVVLLVGGWELGSLMTSPLFLPGPVRVAQKGWQLMTTGQLFMDAGASMFRIVSGWAIGAIIAVPAGLLAGRVVVIRTAFEPIVNFFRFVPPIALLTLALVWFGLGEASKISLIIYTSAFFVFLNTTAGAQGIEKEKLRAAASLGASKLQLIRTVIIPATVPAIMTGLRLAMGVAFMTVVAAELVAAQSGIGFLIYNSRVYGETDTAFVGIATLGVMGLITDGFLRIMFRGVAYRYEIKY